MNKILKKLICASIITPVVCCLPLVLTSCSEKSRGVNAEITDDLLTFNQFGFENFSNETIINTINYDWLLKNQEILFSNYQQFNKFGIEDVKCLMPNENLINISFKQKYKNETKNIQIFRTLATDNGDINLALLNNQSPNVQLYQNYDVKITNNKVKRKVNKSYYSSELLNKYKKYGFRYPAWNFNYRKENTEFKAGKKGPILDMYDLVMNERVPGNAKQENPKYNDATWIREEILNKKLKKHPAADGIWEQQLNKKEYAVEKYFSIPSTFTGPTSCGLFAPAGEVCKIQFSKKTYDLMSKYGINNFKIILNSSYWDNRDKTDSGKISNRYPYMRTEFTVKLEDINKQDYTYEFGSPFGGSISVFVNSKIKSSTYNDFYPSYQNYEFSISGACECLSYFHGVTTEQQWNDQIERIKNGTLTAPNCSFDFQYGSGNIPFTGIKQVANMDINDVQYPQKAINRWNNFLFCSEYFNSRDLRDNVTKVQFWFNDDIWGGAGAWGGGNNLYCPIDWSKSFIHNREFNIVTDWGNFHEINHNFEENNAFFIKHGHGETNQATIANLALISNVTRWRNLSNITGEYIEGNWTELSNSYSVLDYIINKNYSCDEYPIYAIMLHNLLGPYNYIDYVRHDTSHDNGSYTSTVDSNSKISKEGGFYEILELSDYFKLNFWPAIRNFKSIWFDDGEKWSNDHKIPDSVESATAFQKKAIEDLNKNYKAFDFLGNIYACGVYMYDNATGNYIYNHDSQAPYQIPAGSPYVFDFENGINWLKNRPDYNFSWSQLEFDAKTKLGGTLSVEPGNNKKLIYTPPINSISDIDEFDIAIVPDNFTGKPDNYVSKYKWKIKVRQEVKAPVFNTYSGWNENYNLDGMVDAMMAIDKGEKSKSWDLKKKYSDVHDFNVNNGIAYNKKDGKFQGISTHFVFVAPETGKYKFQVRHDIDARVYIDDENVYSKTGGTGYIDIKNEYELKKGSKLKFDAFIITRDSTYPKFGMKAIFNDNQNIDMMKNVLIPNIDEVCKKTNTSYNEFLINSKYDYKDREIDYNQIQTSMGGINVSRQIDFINKDDYTFSTTDPKITGNALKNLDSNLKDNNGNSNRLEVWNTTSSGLTLDVTFKQPTDVKNIFFYHRTDNWWEGRPTSMVIKDQDDKELYNGEYGVQRNDRSKSISVFTLDSDEKVTKLKFEFKNTKLDAIIFTSIMFSDSSILKPNKVLSMINPAITPYGKWKYISNSTNENISDINGQSIKSTNEGDTLSFEMFAKGFDLIGQKNLNNSNFEIYINDQLVDTIDTNSNDRYDNQILFSYTSNNPLGENLKIKIVNKSNKPLYLNYIQTYGEKVIFSH